MSGRRSRLSKDKSAGGSLVTGRYSLSLLKRSTGCMYLASFMGGGKLSGATQVLLVCSLRVLLLAVPLHPSSHHVKHPSVSVHLRLLLVDLLLQLVLRREGLRAGSGRCELLTDLFDLLSLLRQPGLVKLPLLEGRVEGWDGKISKWFELEPFVCGCGVW